MKLRFQPVFLVWILIASLIAVGTVFFFITGLAAEVNRVDFTRITFLIYGTFLVLTIRTGQLTYRAAHEDADIDKIIDQHEWGWFASDCFISAGMIGTVAGFILMLSTSFTNVTSANVQHIIVFALGKMGLALYTTAAGLVCSLILKIQAFNLSQYLNKR